MHPALSSKPMRHETVFSKGGAYRYIVEHDLLLHQEAMHTVHQILKKWAEAHPQQSTVRVLDLACGGAPIIIAKAMGEFPDRRFDYVGVDINHDQIASAHDYNFAPNTCTTLEEADCWELDALISQGPFDIVFIGLNTHHAIPEELQYLAKQLRRLVNRDGFFINFDFFRPKTYTYLRRPDRAPHSHENLQLVPKMHLTADDITVKHTGADATDWRQNFIHTYENIMRQHGMSKKMIAETIQHVSERDYPVAAEDWAQILARTGFETQIYTYKDSPSPLKQYFETVVATPKH